MAWRDDQVKQVGMTARLLHVDKTGASPLLAMQRGCAHCGPPAANPQIGLDHAGVRQFARARHMDGQSLQWCQTPHRFGQTKRLIFNASTPVGHHNA